MAPTARVIRSLVIGVFFFASSLPASAEIVIHGTRMVYPANAREVTMKINNPGNSPVLIQSWIDDGDLNKTPEEIKVPFQLAPTLSRLDSGSSAMVRVVYLQEPLPSDRESLYWLNLLEVPAQRAEDSNRLAFTFRHRLKLFFRPQGLKVDPHSAAQNLSWKFEAAGRLDGATSGPLVPVLRVSNPTPYYLSFSKIEVQRQGRVQALALGTGMVAPFAQSAFAWPQGTAPGAKEISVRFETVNDFGGRVALEKPLL
ncbi:fimbria/pilus periplasmic chaperone [Pseudomonas sp. NFXW11]|uniref:fimbrial biogenesis chaperone n=1 Tax=Pseudomonas sp. NFXW11 TaxID=2819531 RepID=UPI003CF90FFE